MACRLTFITLECYTQYNVMFICVLAELCINSEKNNKRGQASDPIWKSIVFLILPLIKTFTCLVCVSNPLHAHTYQVGHEKRNQILMAEKNTAFSYDLLIIIL